MTTIAERVARRFQAARQPIKQRLIAIIKAEGGEIARWDLMGHIRHRGTGYALRSLIKGGYVTEFTKKDEDGDDETWLRLESEPEYLARSGKISKSKLEAWCKRKGWPMPSYEAYGRQVHAYWFKNPPNMDRREMESELESVGGKVSSEWNRGRPGTSITNISYFKAHGWNE